MADEPSWLTLSEAAERSGLNREALRARARRGLVASRKGNSGEVLVQVPAGLLAGDGRAEAGPPAGGGQDMADLTADLQAEVSELRVALARAEAGRDAAKATAAAEALATREVVDLLKAQLAETRKPALVRLLEALRRR